MGRDKVFVLEIHVCSLCIFTPVSVEHGYIQVGCTSVDDVLLQSLTSQKVFSNRGVEEKLGEHTQTIEAHRNRQIHI